MLDAVDEQGRVAMRKLRYVAITAAALTLAAAPAMADRIDGNWCFTKGRILSLSIDGPRIVTPGGRKMQGIYDRHGFQYTAPKGEMGDGQIVTMNQIDDDRMHLVIGGRPGDDKKAQLWRRCKQRMS